MTGISSSGEPRASRSKIRASLSAPVLRDQRARAKILHTGLHDVNYT
jgi:hypothetical protein